MARFLRCLERSHLSVVAGDGPAELYKKWGKGVYTEEGSQWILMSRMASKAIRYPSTWQNESYKLFRDTEPRSVLAEEVAA